MVAGLEGGADPGLVVVGLLLLVHVTVVVTVLIEACAVAADQLLAGGEETAQFAEQSLVFGGRCQSASRGGQAYRAVRARGREAMVKASGCW